MPKGQTAKLLPIWRARIDITCSGNKARGRKKSQSLFLSLPYFIQQRTVIALELDLTSRRIYHQKI